jgi:hypothetical protein
MIKESLLEIVNSNLDLGDIRKKYVGMYLERYDEEELSYILRTPSGIVADDLSINFYPGVGFRCSNDPTITGKLPICNVFQNILNKKYKELSS